MVKQRRYKLISNVCIQGLNPKYVSKVNNKADIIRPTHFAKIDNTFIFPLKYVTLDSNLTEHLDVS